MAIVGRDVWVATANDGKVWRIAGDENRTSGTVDVGGQPRDIATDGENLFVTDREGDRVVTIDAPTRAITKRDTVEDGFGTEVLQTRLVSCAAVGARVRRPCRNLPVAGNDSYIAARHDAPSCSPAA